MVGVLGAVCKGDFGGDWPERKEAERRTSHPEATPADVGLFLRGRGGSQIFYQRRVMTVYASSAPGLRGAAGGRAGA